MIKLRGPLTGGVTISKNDDLDELNRKAEHRHSVVPSGTDYAREIRERENQMYHRVNKLGLNLLYPLLFS